MWPSGNGPYPRSPGLQLHGVGAGPRDRQCIPLRPPSMASLPTPPERLSCSVQWQGWSWAGRGGAGRGAARRPSPVITGLGYSGPLAFHPLAPGVWDGAYFPAGCGPARKREAPHNAWCFRKAACLSYGALGCRWPRSAPLHAPRWAPAFSPSPAVTLREAPPLSEAPLSPRQSGEAESRPPGLCVVLGCRGVRSSGGLPASRQPGNGGSSLGTTDDPQDPGRP